MSEVVGAMKSIRFGIIEPQQLFAPFLNQVLSEAGFSIVISLGTLSLDELDRNDPAAVFIDIDFIEGDPINALRQIRQVVPNATICAYTGRADEGWAALCMRAGANCVISKSAATSEIVAGIRRALSVGSYVDGRFDGEDAPLEDIQATATAPISPGRRHARSKKSRRA
jgi:DNA-binding NarL/FixJ family response regulator